MSKKEGKLSRRDFIKTASAIGIGSVLSPVESLTFVKRESDTGESQPKIVPTRPFGKTGVNVSILGVGGAFHWSNLLLLKQAVQMGVTYWDTASSYGNGRSEKAIGKYFEKFPEDRKKVFLVTKTGATDPRSMTRALKTSLERMRTTYIDLYLIHMLTNPYELNQTTKSWVDEAKATGQLRFFGFSTHSIMEKSLSAAAKMGWLDGIMFTYNFRIMHTQTMNKAVRDCFKAGIGLTAMKTQATGAGTISAPLNERERNFLNLFAEKGLTAEQAKLKAVWDDNRIASICSHMTNMKILSDNASTAMDDKKLSEHGMDYLKQYARETAANYCTGCAHICESALNNQVPVSDVMRYLMYGRCYGELERAKSAFKELPSNVRNRLAGVDYRDAENKCPQKMPIGRLMREAVIELV